MTITPNPQNSGLTLTITITIYDDGQVTMDDTPMNPSLPREPARGLLNASSRFNRHLTHLHDRHTARAATHSNPVEACALIPRHGPHGWMKTDGTPIDCPGRAGL